MLEKGRRKNQLSGNIYFFFSEGEKRSLNLRVADYAGPLLVQRDISSLSSKGQVYAMLESQ